MKIAIMQPTFNPWIGYFELIEYVDKFIFLDTVQLAKRSWQVRNKFKINNQEYIFSIPIKKERLRDDTILKDVKISYENFDFTNKLLSLIIQNYKKSKYFEELYEKISEIILYKTDFLCEYNINFIKEISSLLKFNTKFVEVSKIENIEGKKGDLILNICKKELCTDYFSPNGSKEYLEQIKDKFQNSNINIFYQYYNHPVYKQMGKDFLSYLGIIDLLFNEGLDNAKDIIKSGRNYLQ